MIKMEIFHENKSIATIEEENRNDFFLSLYQTEAVSPIDFFTQCDFLACYSEVFKKVWIAYRLTPQRYRTDSLVNFLVDLNLEVEDTLNIENLKKYIGDLLEPGYTFKLQEN